MSRAHMLHEDKKLQSIPVKVTTWNGSWDPEKIFHIKSKSGIIGDAQLLGKSRHLIVDSTQANSKVHYMVFHVDVKKAFRRRYDVNGKEIQPDFGTKQKVNTGFLMSSYKEVSKEGEDAISFKQLQEAMQIEELVRLTQEKEKSFTGRNVVSLWFQESDFDGIEFLDGCDVRFRTKGDKCYIESITCLDVDTKNLSSYTTDQPLGGSWTDKVMAQKNSDKTCDVAAQCQGEAAEDDEWVYRTLDHSVVDELENLLLDESVKRIRHGELKCNYYQIAS
eukprot:gene19906-21851_t